MLNRFLTIAFAFISVSLSAQRTNVWRDHFSYRQPLYIAENETAIATANNIGIIVYSKVNGNTSKLNRINGLSDVDISAIEAISSNMFIIGYENGNIDIIEGSKVINLPDLKNKVMQGSKRFNTFHMIGNLIYCATDFGILVINHNKLEIADTYYLGTNSASLQINDIASDDTYLYAATAKGLLRAEINNPQIAYFEAWTNIGSSALQHFHVKTLGDKLVTSSRLGTQPYQIHVGQENDWKLFRQKSTLKSMYSAGSDLIISENRAITRFNGDLQRLDSVTNYLFEDTVITSINANIAIYSNNAFAIADNEWGLVVKQGNFDEYHLINGPYSNSTFKLMHTPYGMYNLAGDLTGDYNNKSRAIEFSLYNNEWTYYKSNKKGEESIWRDLIRICVNPKNDSVYMGSWGSGIFSSAGANIRENFNQYNSGLRNIFGPTNPSYVRVGGVASDRDGNIWITNCGVDSGIVVKSYDAEQPWYQFDYQTLKGLHSTSDILMSSHDYLWVIVPRTEKKGLVVIDTKGTFLDQSDDVYKGALKPSSETDSRNVGQLKLWNENLEVITDMINTIVEDKNGYIWLGTDQGVAVYYRPRAIFTDDYPIVSRIKIPRNDGSNQADYLLEKEQVTAIAVDGANRKWLGTNNSGLYLVSEDGTKTYAIFNTDNSVLPSNTIRSVAIDPLTGEVFIGTDKGVVSYMGDATEGSKNLDDVYAYPNPVRESFNGNITITGLKTDSNVKITTVSGKLVHETRSLGGKAYWNGKNFTGEKVKSGVYIVYVSADDGEVVSTTKILITR